MSFSDKFSLPVKNAFEWKVFNKREEALQEVELVSPVAEISTILMHHQTTQQQERELAEQERKQFLDMLAQQATHFTELMVVLERYNAVLENPQEHIETIKRAYRSLRIVKDKMLDDFRKEGFEIDIPLGKKYEDVKEDVDIQDWRNSDKYTEETVIEVLRPIVRYKGTRLRTGLVIMGAPPEADTDATISEA
jgi:hypothetical protein